MSGEQPLKIKKISKASYNSLISEGTIAPNTIYIIINDDGLTGDLYFGNRNIVNQEHILKRIERNVPNGFVGLDENGEIDDAYLPDSSLGIFHQDIELKPIDVAEEVGEAFNSHQIILSSSILELQDQVGPELITSSPELLSTTFAAQDLAFSEDGLSVFVIDSTTDSINQYSLLTPFDVSTLNTTPIATRSVIETNPYGLVFKPDGTSLYYIGSTNRKIYQCDLSTPWDLSTAQAEKESPLLTNGTYQSLFFSSNGSKVYILNSTTDVVQIHTLWSAWQITSLSTTASASFSVTSQETTPTGIYISPNGLKLFLVGSSADKVFEYNLSSAWGNSATFTGNSITVKQNVTNGITFRPDGLIMFLVGSTNKQIDAYSIPFAFSLGTDANEKETKEKFKLKVKPVAETTDASLELTYNKDDQPSTVILKVSKDGTIKDGTNDKLVGTQLNGVQKEFIYANGEIVVNQSKGTTKLNGAEAIVKTKNVSWATLVSLRDTSKLIPGQQYRITNYETTTTQVDTQSASHPFDIIVTADDVDKLNENATAKPRYGDNYFANSKLEAWKLKYCLDNDVTRFAWADARRLQFGNNTYFLSSRVVKISSVDYHLWVSTDVYGYKTYLGTLSTSLQTGDSLYYIILEGEDDWYIEDSYDFEGSMLSVGGKGVIYNMVDEFGNSRSFDFKNIQFKVGNFHDADNDITFTDLFFYAFSGYDFSLATGIQSDIIDTTVLSKDQVTNGTYNKFNGALIEPLTDEGYTKTLAINSGESGGEYATVAYVNQALGDISSALDALLGE